MKKKMGCKADGEDEYRSNLMVVRISSRHPTQQTAFYASNTAFRTSVMLLTYTNFNPSI